MKSLFDTSVIVAGLVESHPMHAKSFPWLKRAHNEHLDLIVASHTIAELYAVLTTLPLKPKISTTVAWQLINENVISFSKVISLTAKEYSSTLKRLSEMGLFGGITYDALIAKVAEKTGVERLLTLNTEHFRRVWPEGEKIIAAP